MLFLQSLIRSGKESYPPSSNFGLLLTIAIEQNKMRFWKLNSIYENKIWKKKTLRTFIFLWFYLLWKTHTFVEIRIIKGEQFLRAYRNVSFWRNWRILTLFVAYIAMHLLRIVTTWQTMDIIGTGGFAFIVRFP